MSTGEEWIAEAATWPEMSIVERTRLIRVFRWLNQRAVEPPGNDRGPAAVGSEPDLMKTTARWSKTPDERRCQGQNTDSESKLATSTRGNSTVVPEVG